MIEKNDLSVKNDIPVHRLSQLVVLTQPNIDLMWVADRAVTYWLPAGGGSLQDGNQINYSFHRVDMWIRFIAAVVSKDHALTLCPRAIAHAWPIVYTRLNTLFPSIDPRCVCVCVCVCTHVCAHMHVYRHRCVFVSLLNCLCRYYAFFL